MTMTDVDETAGETITPPEQTQPPVQETKEISDMVRQARELIPVERTGAMPQNFAQQVDFAKTMALARNALPEHLRGNAGDCLAIIDMSARAGLSPYMVANKTYIQNGRMCFESQLFHAFAQASRLMNGDLNHDFVNEGDEMVCIVTGYLRGDPRPKIHRSEPLKKAHPGFSLKKGSDKTWMGYAEGMKLIREADEKNESVPGISSRGSPLWIKKPRVQMFYDTSRDWIRIFIPQAVLGIYSPEEMIEYGPDNAKDVTPGLRDRLNAGERAQTGEGFMAGHVEREISNLGDPRQVDIEDLIEPKTATRPPNKHEQAIARAKASAGRVADRAAATGKAKAKGATQAQPKPGKPKGKAKLPETATEYTAYAEAWIAEATDADDAEQRWEGELDLRTECLIPTKERNRLHLMLQKRFEG